MSTADPKPQDPKEEPKPDLAKELEALKQELAALKSAGAKPKPEEDQDLNQKAKVERDRKETDEKKSKAIESALKFDLQSESFLKDNAALLPEAVSDVFKQASKEKFNDAMEKEAAIKSGVIQSFFNLQANVDLLTPSQKTQLDDYLKMTKNGKQEKAQAIYEMIFEPAFEMLKRIKKAEALQRGLGSGDDDDYKKRLIAGSRKHYLGEAKNA